MLREFKWIHEYITFEEMRVHISFRNFQRRVIILSLIASEKLSNLLNRSEMAEVQNETVFKICGFFWSQEIHIRILRTFTRSLVPSCQIHIQTRAHSVSRKRVWFIEVHIWNSSQSFLGARSFNSSVVVCFLLSLCRGLSILWEFKELVFIVSV